MQFSSKLIQRKQCYRKQFLRFKTIIKQLRRSDGVGILLVLGLMSCVFIMAFSFVVVSVTNHKIAANLSAESNSRIMAQTGLQHALASINQYSRDMPKDLLNTYVYSKNIEYISDSAKKECLGGAEGLMNTTMNGITYYSLPESDYNAEDEPTWLYLPPDHGPGKPITGRIAYIALSDLGRIDLSACIDSGYNAGVYSESAISEYNPPSEATMIDLAGNPVIGRPGRSVSELFLDTLPSSWFTKEYAEKISSGYASGGMLRLDGGGWTGRWSDFSRLFDKLDAKKKHRNFFKAYFTLNSPPDPEAFWIDSNGDQIKDSNELYHRFDLTRNDWNSLTPDSVKSDPLPFTVPYSKAPASSIPWLKNWKCTGEMGSIDSCRNQVIANLIDYNDSDSAATTDYPAVEPPGYVGLEKCPYINEVKLAFSGSVTCQGSQYKCLLKISKGWIEVVNMYDTPMGVTIYMDLAGTFKWNPKGKLEKFSAQNIPVKLLSLPKQYAVGNFPEYVLFSETFMDDREKPESSVNQLQINKLRIKLIDSSAAALVDYANIIDESNVTVERTVTADGSEGFVYFDAQIADPRQNLLPGDWNRSKNGIVFGSDPEAGTVISPYTNSNFAPWNGDDAELYGIEPWGISTAYIRNAPMKSPWELGFIHRGSAWQTLNLKKYNFDGNIGSGGGGNYNDGDANILDQIKMAPDTKTYGKININSDLKNVFTLLFQKIRVGSDINSADGPGCVKGTLEIDEEKAFAFADELLANNPVGGKDIFYTRAQMVRAKDSLSEALSSDGIIQATDIQLNRNTDAKQEEIIGKLINLTKASGASNVFEVIVVAQSIKDNGSKGGKGMTIYEDKNLDGKVTGPDEKIQNCKIGAYDPGADKILATQKIFVTAIRDLVKNTFKIKKFEYLTQ